MGCWSQDRFANKMQRMQNKMERMRGRMESRGGFGSFGRCDDWQEEERLGEVRAVVLALEDHARLLDHRPVDHWTASSLVLLGALTCGVEGGTPVRTGWTWSRRCSATALRLSAFHAARPTTYPTAGTAAIQLGTWT